MVAKDSKGVKSEGPVWSFTTMDYKWKFETGDWVYLSPAIGKDRTICVGGLGIPISMLFPWHVVDLPMVHGICFIMIRITPAPMDTRVGNNLNPTTSAGLGRSYMIKTVEMNKPLTSHLVAAP